MFNGVCGRCHTSFKSQELLVKHHREQLQCPIKEPEIITGKVTLEQAAKLRAARKKSSVSDEKTWFEWYRIIFPDDSPSMPLTPYHESSTASSMDISNTQMSTSISSYRDTLVGPSGMRKKQKLEASLEDWGVSDPKLRKTLALRVQEYQFQHLQEWIETSDGSLMNQNVADVDVQQLQMEDPFTFINFGQDPELELFGLEW
ncbi:hypothetical protein FSARC_5455 [Fusarium sarcochroum]|uniref:C2H2-type domain-containing protein n=1 Tax=Fusarium sarcochroum TaxID=1208366 RepID=A0A8H4TZL4_9HYPO|nr:hypothetical protein FSARC_5455 [Fusarium sarcochroum]